MPCLSRATTWRVRSVRVHKLWYRAVSVEKQSKRGEDTISRQTNALGARRNGEQAESPLADLVASLIACGILLVAFGTAVTPLLATPSGKSDFRRHPHRVGSPWIRRFDR